jgi:hypothetical protein
MWADGRKEGRRCADATFGIYIFYFKKLFLMLQFGDLCFWCVNASFAEFLGMSPLVCCEAVVPVWIKCLQA